MKKKLQSVFIILFLLSVIAAGRAAEQQYAYHTIPAELLSGAHAVVRESSYNFTVHNVQSATLEVSYAITVLDERGSELTPLLIFYDQQRKVKNIECRVFDKSGALIKKVKRKEIEGFSNAQGSLFQDNRVKYFKFASSQYPYTLSYSYRIEYDGLLHYPRWQPLSDYGVAVEKSAFTITSLKEIAFRIKKLI